MKIASWNVNGLRARLAHVLEWLKVCPVDLLAVQETKVQDQDFPRAEIEAAGYRAVFSGQKSYNGVAFLYRSEGGEGGESGSGAAEPPLPAPPSGAEQKRALVMTMGGVRVVNLYVVNGKEVGCEAYAYKLQWLDAVRTFLESELARFPDTVVLGDFNVAPRDCDVHDPEQWRGRILCSDAERAALETLLALGLVDVFRLFEQPLDTSFSWWDYRRGDFEHNRGLRIDLLLATTPLAERCLTCAVDTTPRAWDRPSDHAPVVAEFA